ncbi:MULTISPECIES: CDP-glycerol glycerophosphotransferase family protein [unclassified Providencia]|uniref:CDP-glycerol glycerophosphotransferase family protein n=1 Tax=unclassified Providencia TaxID=2633465 RepID=UPI002349B427|nr:MULTISPECIES: CDP-glycerol glycerophosphotransferase family protein [unclassified Providencia]
MKNLIKILILWPLYYISGFFSRDNKIWLFGSYRNKFNDNTKYSYLKCHHTYKNIKCYWISDDDNIIAELKNKGYHAVKRRSIKGMIIMLKAGVYFVSSYTTDICFWTSRNVFYVNLWHGLPLKKIEYDIRSGPLFNKYNNENLFNKIKYRTLEPECFKKPNLMFAPSDFWCSILSSAFKVNKENFIICSFPRTDIFFDNIDLQKIYLEFEKEAQKIIFKPTKRKKILLMPTFRDNGTDYFKASGIQLDDLSRFAESNNLIFYIKLHPSDHFSSTKADLKGVKIITNVVSDIYPYLNTFDLLVTDYSSIYLDYVLLNKPLLFYPFDIIEYKQESREMYFDYDEFTPGDKAYTYSELKDMIIKNLVHSDKTQVQHNFLKKYYSNATLKNSDDIYKRIIEKLNIGDDNVI